MSTFTLTPADLLTVAGVATVTALVVQLFIKPLISNLIESGKLNEKWYPVVMNAVTLVLSVVFVALGLWAFNDLTRLTVVQGVLTAVVASALAIGGYEVTKNVSKLATGKPVTPVSINEVLPENPK